MKKDKMSLEKMKGVLGNVLSRQEMKQVMAGSGTCGSCYDGYHYGTCYRSTMTGFCACNLNGYNCNGLG